MVVLVVLAVGVVDVKIKGESLIVEGRWIFEPMVDFEDDDTVGVSRVAVPGLALGDGDGVGFVSLPRDVELGAETTST